MGKSRPNEGRVAGPKEAALSPEGLEAPTADGESGRHGSELMPLHLEIVTPERLAYSDEVDMVLVPGIDGELGILPHHTPLVSLLGMGELRIRKGGDEESFAIVGGFLQVRPDKVVVMAETADLASEIDLGRAQEARREAERALESGFHEGADLVRRAGPAPARAAAHPRRRAPAPGGPSLAGVTRMADATAVPLGVPPGRAAPEAFRIEGGRPLTGTVHVSGAKNAALKLLAAAVLTGERCRLENVPEIEDVRVMTEVLRDLGVVVDHPGPACTRSRRATSTGCSSRSRPRPRCAPRSSCWDHCSRGSAG